MISDKYLFVTIAEWFASEVRGGSLDDLTDGDLAACVRLEFAIRRQSAQDVRVGEILARLSSIGE